MHASPFLPRLSQVVGAALLLVALFPLWSTLEPAYAQTTGQIQGVVFQDLNANGAKDAFEPGLGGVQVLLRNANNLTEGTTLTSAAGEFSFAAVAPGVYTVVATSPSGYVNTTPNEVPVSVTAGATVAVAFGKLATATAVPPQNGYIWGFVINDLNFNGQADPGEPGLQGVSVRLYDESDNLLATVTTDVNGFYDFGVRPVGTYRIEFTPPTGTNASVPAEVSLTLTSGQLVTQFFGAREPFSLYAPTLSRQ